MLISIGRVGSVIRKYLWLGNPDLRKIFEEFIGRYCEEFIGRYFEEFIGRLCEEFIGTFCLAF